MDCKGSRTPREDMSMKKSQRELILEHLKNHGKITSIEAIDQYGATRLSSIIFNLRKEGYNIATLDTAIKDRYGTRKTIATYKLLDR